MHLKAQLEAKEAEKKRLAAELKLAEAQKEKEEAYKLVVQE